MPTTYVAAISLAERQYITPDNPHGWVPGFDKDPAKFLQDVAQPFADAGIRLMLHNAFGRGGKFRTFNKRFDGQPASVTVVEAYEVTYNGHHFVLSNFVKSPGMEGTFLYIGAPDIHRDSSLCAAADRLMQFKAAFPGCIPIYDNTGDIDATELCAGSALMAAHDAMDRAPFNSPVPWGVEPNPAVKNNKSALRYRPNYTYGTPATWSAESRLAMTDTFDLGTTPIVAIRGDDYPTPEIRVEVARRWGPLVEPYNGIVVVHDVSVEQMQELTR